MNQLRPVDTASWPRREHFEHYRHRVPCTYAATVDLDVTALVAALRAASRKTYVAQVWALATVVDRHAAFRTDVTPDGAPGVWDVLHPAFTVLNPERETFASVWAPYDRDFASFHAHAAALLAEHRGATAFVPQDDVPPNTFDVSSLPWTRFTSFTLQLAHGWEHLRPIFTLGRQEPRGDRTLLPLAIQVHHAAVDGFHLGRFVEDLEALVADPSWVV
ncbi:CatA-like O-acetyltransferase [Cellulosimicrobium marinum]|uniref:CatA-like O-acetyltransferase n=1 Tax=Cellulosimicrobium marinum TaxID=1638992 RepID=UPI001E4D46F7|nr:CatA-like O-acetyltransferase [Cellulosimicrobium marinum]MCB7135101.1 chloramphenicol acetyltransferase [Cellulosimicrobium marinum]